MFADGSTVHMSLSVDELNVLFENEMKIILDWVTRKQASSEWVKD